MILDNCCYGTTGSQPTCTHLGTDLAALALAAGVESVKKADNLDDLAKALTGRGIVVAKVEAGNASVPVIDLATEEIIDRFMRSAQSAEPS